MSPMLSARHVRILLPVFSALLLFYFGWRSTHSSLDTNEHARQLSIYDTGALWLGKSFGHQDVSVEHGSSAAHAASYHKYDPLVPDRATLPHIPSSHLHHPTIPQSFHDQLSTVNLYPPAQYGPETLSIFQRIWVLTLKSKKDRERHMSELASALNLNFTYHYGRNPFENDEDRKAVEDIGTYTHWFREQYAYEDGEQEVMPNGRKKMFKFEWLPDAASGNDSRIQPDDLQGADLWVLPDGDPRKPQLPQNYPRYRLESDGKGGLEATGRSPPQGVELESEMYLGQDWAGMTPGKVGCYWSHYELIRRIAESEEEGPQLILEDDVDMEWDINNRLRQMWQHLPPWDIVYLGHCYIDHGNKNPIPGTPYIRPMNLAMCAHAYAITPRAARRLVRFLRSPLFAFGRPIDANTNELFFGINRFVVDPPVVVQMPKDMLPTNSGTSEFMQWLGDSVFQRVARLSRRGTGRKN